MCSNANDISKLFQMIRVEVLVLKVLLIYVGGKKETEFPKRRLMYICLFQMIGALEGDHTSPRVETEQTSTIA